jgi:response regulator NasT
MSSTELIIMIVDDNAERATALRAVMVATGYKVTALVSASDYLPDRVKELNPDVILTDIDAPGRDPLESISAVQRDLPRPIVMLTMNEDAATIQAAIHAGVSAYVVDGLRSPRVSSLIEMAIAHFKHYQSLKGELEKTKSTLQECKLIDRAKGLLMAQRNITEPEAYAMLRSLAMNRKRRIGDVATDVIELAEVLNHDPTMR